MDNKNDIKNTPATNIDFISLNEWLKTIETETVTYDGNTLKFSEEEKNNDSEFMKKVKKALLQKNIAELIKNKKRSFF